MLPLSNPNLDRVLFNPALHHFGQLLRGKFSIPFPSLKNNKLITWGLRFSLLFCSRLRTTLLFSLTSDLLGAGSGLGTGFRGAGRIGGIVADSKAVAFFYCRDVDRGFLLDCRGDFFGRDFLDNLGGNIFGQRWGITHGSDELVVGFDSGWSQFGDLGFVIYQWGNGVDDGIAHLGGLDSDDFKFRLKA